MAAIKATIAAMIAAMIAAILLLKEGVAAIKLVQELLQELLAMLVCNASIAWGGPAPGHHEGGGCDVFQNEDQPGMGQPNNPTQVYPVLKKH